MEGEVEELETRPPVLPLINPSSAFAVVLNILELLVDDVELEDPWILDNNLAQISDPIHLQGDI